MYLRVVLLYVSAARASSCSTCRMLPFFRSKLQKARCLVMCQYSVPGALSSINKVVFLCGTFFFRLQSTSWYCIYFSFKFVFVPWSEEVEPLLVEMGLNALGEFPRAVSRLSAVAVARTSDYHSFIFR